MGIGLMSEGKIDELIRHKRAFLRQSKPDYAAGGGDMLDDLEATLRDAKDELMRNLELAGCIKEESEAAYQKECAGMYAAWFEKWFGKA